MNRGVASTATVADDRACVKTHTSAKCRKHNSPTRHRTSRVQYVLTLRDAIDQRDFYVWRERWSFRTAKTQLGHRPDRSPAVQQVAGHGTAAGYFTPASRRAWAACQVVGRPRGGVTPPRH